MSRDDSLCHSPANCPRLGEVREFPVLGLPGASFSITFAGPKVGRLYGNRLARLAAAEAPTEDDAEQCIRALVGALVASVNNVRGFKANDSAEVLAFLEYLSNAQVLQLIDDALRFQVVDLSTFVAQGTAV